MQSRSQAFNVRRGWTRAEVQAAKRQEEESEDLIEQPDTEALLQPQPSGPHAAATSYGSPRDMEPTADAAARRAAFARNRSLTMTRTKRRWWRSDARALKEILSNWANVLLVTVPLGLIAGALNWTAEYVFVLNFLALIPLALILGDVTEDLALRYGSVIGGLINATFGNIVEVILSIAALLNGLYAVVAASLLGSILSNLLLVTGCSFFFGGLFNKTQKFNATGSQASGSLLFLAALGFLIPAGAALLFGSGDVDSNSELVLGISRGTAVVLLLCYGCYLGFQLYTHTDLFEDTPEESSASGGPPLESQEPMMSLVTSLTLLTVVTLTVAAASESMGVAVGSSIQVALFAVPFAVVVGWITDHPFTLDFDPFSAMALMLSVAQSNFVTAGATSHWLLGVQLIALYVLLSLAYYFNRPSVFAMCPLARGFFALRYRNLVALCNNNNINNININNINNINNTHTYPKLPTDPPLFTNDPPLSSEGSDDSWYGQLVAGSDSGSASDTASDSDSMSDTVVRGAGAAGLVAGTGVAVEHTGAQTAAQGGAPPPHPDLPAFAALARPLAHPGPTAPISLVSPTIRARKVLFNISSNSVGTCMGFSSSPRQRVNFATTRYKGGRLSTQPKFLTAAARTSRDAGMEKPAMCQLRATVTFRDDVIVCSCPLFAAHGMCMHSAVVSKALPENWRAYARGDSRHQRPVVYAGPVSEADLRLLVHSLPLAAYEAEVRTMPPVEKWAPAPGSLEGCMHIGKAEARLMRELAQGAGRYEGPAVMCTTATASALFDGTRRGKARDLCSQLDALQQELTSGEWAELESSMDHILGILARRREAATVAGCPVTVAEWPRVPRHLERNTSSSGEGLVASPEARAARPTDRRRLTDRVVKPLQGGRRQRQRDEPGMNTEEEEEAGSGAEVGGELAPARGPGRKKKRKPATRPRATGLPPLAPRARTQPAETGIGAGTAGMAAVQLEDDEDYCVIVE
ncbi:hypothetical protein VOLCADRAFT_108492 [Volvox carteri f. nagariensis]|uniref:SWIM-type domain-containing protein n=1 Tax=Volvox carteri f. nagariensis TaxID=3068 RepID=D8UKF6_VOLCA|nr:uncharacterized protein VOLCADRAFT_108492 [Volvox carteri f. nagariensis]EFJ39789.1 hypothetical protein VOLCADRAFT_108492 [Volvox carteri f. nagariensis]|eukprot:XP_002959140.1 hypothetical protein VOLCADRAFT_108492 [Volvox carteri f. nagariensis]